MIWDPIVAALDQCLFFYFMDRQINLNTRNLKIIPNKKKKKCKLNTMRYFCGSVYYRLLNILYAENKIAICHKQTNKAGYML